MIMDKEYLTKICPKCNVEKPVSDFSKNKTRKDGFEYSCRACVSRYQKSLATKPKQYVDVKFCGKCKIEKVASKFSKRNGSRDALHSFCRDCVSEYDKQYAKRPKPRTKNKKCGKCRIEKPAREFHKNNGSKDGLFAFCKACATECGNVWAKRPKKCVASKLCKKCGAKKVASEFQKSNRTSDGLKNICKGCVMKNGEAYRKTYPVRVAANKRKYNQTFKGKRAAYRASHIRRSLAVNATIEQFNPHEVLIRDGYICQLCGIKTNPHLKNHNHPKYPNLDHIVPLSKGGEHSRKNTQCLCHRCNCQKGNSGVGDQLRMWG
jgi:hypothetical protein